MQFSAPWSPTLQLTTWGTTTVLIVLGVFIPMVAVLMIGILVASALSSVRGYSVLDDELLVHRLGWSTRIPLDGLEHVTVDPDAMRGSIRTFGNGGLFAFTGRFRNATLGPYRAFATDTEACVVLEFGDETVVVTPDQPVEFVVAIEAAR